MTEEFKIILGIIAGILGIIWYIPYTIDIIKWETKPHFYTWFLWLILTTSTGLIQYFNNWWAWTWATFSTAFMCLIILIISIWKCEKEITIWDKISFLLAIIAIIFWLFIKNDLIAISLITFIEAMAFYPTIRKSFEKLYEETLSTYIVASFRAFISIFALTQINSITIMYPLFLVLICSWFSLQLIILRKKTKN